MAIFAMRSAAAIVAVLLAGTAPAVAGTGSWRIYENFRWGFRIDVPRSLVSQPEPENGGGLGFVSADGRVRLSTYGGYDEEPVTDMREKQSDTEWEWVGSTGRITYRAIGPNWFALSGIKDDGRVFYQRYERRTLDGDTTCYVAFEITYPQSLRAAWSANTTRIAKSFRVPQGGCLG